MALVSHALIGQRRIATYNLHLESRDRDELRLSQLIEVLDDTRRYSMEVPIILAGDLNFDVREPSSSRLLEEANVQNPFSALGTETAHAHWFGRRSVIDWIVTRGPIVAASPKIDHSVSASDHYPLSLTIELPVTP